MMVGRKLEDQYPRVDVPTGSVRLQLQNISGPGVTNASFSLKSGEILGVSGLMGAGRTELMKIIYGAAAKKTGTITLEGKEVTLRTPQDT